MIEPDVPDFSSPWRAADRATPRAVVAAFALAWMLALAAIGCVGAGVTPQPAPISVAGAKAPEPGSPSAEERRLHELLNQYRVANHLAPVGLSRSLSKVARLHATDLAGQRLSGSCSIHSWSQGGPWSSCCYDQRRPDTKCMWNKPRELTPYEGIGFEIAYRYTAGVRAKGALAAWQASARHNSILLNLDGWSSRQWRAVGIGIDGEYATVWWGEDVDPAGYWQ